MMLLAEAKKLICEKYGFTIVEELNLGMYKGKPVKGESRAPSEIAIKSDLDDAMKLVAIAHEAGHLIEYKKAGLAWLHGSNLKVETRAWLNGLPLAIELDILPKYIDYWKVHLEKL